MPAKLRRRSAHKGLNGFVLPWERLEGRQLLAAHVTGDPTVYATIQAAVNAALTGGTVTVDAGTYNEQVVVSKPLTIKGAQAGVDARSLPRVYNQTAESIVTGTTNAVGAKTSAFYIDSDNVTIDGFTMQGQTSAGDVGAGVVIAPTRSGMHFLDNILQNNVSGLFISNSNAANPLIVQHNLFRNNNNAGENGGRGILTDGSISGGSISNVVIDGNTFLNNHGTTNTTGLEAAIAFETLATGAQSNITITNNVFDSNGKAVLFFNTTNILIDNNYATNQLDQYSGTFRFEGNNQNVTLTHNTIYNNTGPAVSVDAKGVPGDNSGFVVNYNNIYGNSMVYGSKIGVVFDNTVYVGQPDVRFNYWGSSSGPGGDGPGTGDGVYGIGHVQSGNQWFVAKGGNELFSGWATSTVGTGLFPYFGAAPTDNMIVQAEDFDHGGEGVAYHDAESTNQGGKTYRKWQGVDVESTTDSGGGYDVGYVKPGEWLDYSMFLPLGGTFTFQARVACAGAGGNFHFEVDGVNVTGTMTIPNTGAYQTWTTISKAGVNLSPGNHVIRIVMDSTSSGGTFGNFNWFKLINTAPAMIPPLSPSNLLATAVDQTHVTLSWQDKSPDELNFLVERKTGAAGVWQQIATLPANSTGFIDSTATAATSYTYRVSAIGYGGTSTPSNESAATTLAAPTIVYLSDLTWVSMSNGFGPVKIDLANGGSEGTDGTTLTLNGVTYTKGLGAHAPSQIVYNIAGGGYSTFQSDIGVDDRQTVNGSVDFQVYLDGVLAYDSGVMGATSPTQHISVDVTGKSQLMLVVTDGGDGNDYDHADWAGARLLIPPPPPLPPSAPNAPTNLLATPISYTQVNLSWDNVTGETGYKIERSTDGVNFTPIGTTLADVTTYSDMTALPGTSYTYRVRASNAVGDSDPSIAAPANTPALPPIPAIPDGLVATAMSFKRIDLSWNDVAGETGFKIERSLDGVTFTPLTTTAANVTSYSDLTCSQTTQYYYRVRATNISGDSDASLSANATTPVQPQPPAIPSGLAASAASGTQINLSWTDVSGETSYKIERSLDNVTFTLLTTVPADQTTFSDLTVAPNTQYFYRVRASNDVGDSDASLVASATTPQVAPAAPSGVAAVAGSSLVINISWTDASNNEDGFRVERSTDGVNFTQIVGLFMNKTSYADTSITAGQQYSYRVFAYNNAGLSPASNVSIVTAPTAPAAPGTLSAVAGAFQQVNLSWGDVSGETGFRIERSSDNVNFSALTTLGANVISYTDSTVLAGQTYYYRLFATNGVGDSAASNVANVTIAAAPMGPNISADIGTTGALGSSSKSGTVYTVKGGGADIYGTSDAFQFDYMSFTGNGTIIARVASLTNTDAGSKAGIMFRDSLAANAREASVTITPLNGIKFLTRGSTGGQTASVSTATTLKAPYWLKLVRSGNTFTSYSSSNGTTWTLIGTQTVTMGTTVYVGLAVSSHKAGTLATATFDNVSVG